MKFNNWTLEELINYLKDAKLSTDFPYTHRIRCSGQINIYKGENKSTGELDSDIEEVLE